MLIFFFFFCFLSFILRDPPLSEPHFFDPVKYFRTHESVGRGTQMHLVPEDTVSLARVTGNHW